METNIKKTVIASVAIILMGIMSSCTYIRPGMVTTASSIKTGKVEKTVWFGLAFDVDLSAAAAAKKGGITKIATVDHGVTPGLFNVTYFTVVTGE